MIEVMVVIAIVGIIIGMGVSKLNAFQAAKKLDEEGRALLSTIAQARGLALKKDSPHLIAIGAGGYGVYEDRNGNARADSGEMISSHALAAPVRFGAGHGGPSRGPEGIGRPARATEGAWTASLALLNDRSGSLNEGSAYLSAPGIGGKALCIRKRPGARQVEIWRWDGTRWSTI